MKDVRIEFERDKLAWVYGGLTTWLLVGILDVTIVLIVVVESRSVALVVRSRLLIILIIILFLFLIQWNLQSFLIVLILFYRLRLHIFETLV